VTLNYLLPSANASPKVLRGRPPRELRLHNAPSLTGLARYCLPRRRNCSPTQDLRDGNASDHRRCRRLFSPRTSDQRSKQQWSAPGIPKLFDPKWFRDDDPTVLLRLTCAHRVDREISSWRLLGFEPTAQPWARCRGAGDLHPLRAASAQPQT